MITLLRAIGLFLFEYLIGGKLAQMDTESAADVYRIGEAAAHIRLAMVSLPDNPDRALALLEVALQRLNDGC